MRVLGLSRSAAQTPCVEMVFGLSEIDEFVSQLDYLVVVLPNTPETKGIISEGVLKNIRPSAVLINVGRGAAVDESALVKSLSEERLRAAVLDVFNTEPLPEDSPFWKLENAYVTPHNSAFTFPKKIVAIFCDNYRRYRSGEPLKFKIDFDRGY
jgi:phosphoglycerate dehydrogenase-like enzyme